MEEISHVFLGHKANRLAALSELRPVGVADGPTDSRTLTVREGAKPPSKKIVARDYNQADEEAAYAVGAAALVPFASLSHLVCEGRTAEQIAARFRVSRQLVEYRIKVTHLWSDYKR